jgi:hypothetical protein
MMKKLMLDVESLAVESFEVATNDAVQGTVKAASDTGTYPTNTCPPTMMLSQCISGCKQSGIMFCAVQTERCC